MGGFFVRFINRRERQFIVILLFQNMDLDVIQISP